MALPSVCTSKEYLKEFHLVYYIIGSTYSSKNAPLILFSLTSKIIILEGFFYEMPTTAFVGKRKTLSPHYKATSFSNSY